MAGWGTVVYSLGHLAWNVWILGYPDQAIQHSVKARARAEESHDPFNLVHYFGFAGFLHQRRGEVEKVLELSEECIGVCQENAFHLNMAWASMQKGWAMSEKGDSEKGLAMMLDGLTTWRAVGMVVIVPYWHALIAEMYGKLNQPEEGLTLLRESMDIVNATGYRFHEAELHRIKGELLLQQGSAASDVQSCYEKALKVARAQEAKSYEMRAAMSLVRLWQSQGKNKQAKEMLNKIYSWFTEGFETRDLREAKQLLAEL
jgi:tetratricopeptide (TPR) repeat protein